MDYLKKPFVIETRSGVKLIVATFRQFTALKGEHKEVARMFVNGCGTVSTENLIARKQESFELIQ